MTTGAITTTPSRLAAASRAVAEFCDALEPAVLTGEQAAAVAAELAGMTRRLTAAQVRVAGRVDETRAFRQRGAQDTAGWLATTTGTSVAEARRLLNTGERLEACPQTKEAFEAGELSLQEAEVVTRAVKADPSSESRLVDLAKRKHHMKGLNELADRVRHGAHNAKEAAEKAAAVRASRRWVESRDPVDGAPRIDAKFVPEDWAQAKQVLAAYQDQIFNDARRAGRHEASAAYAADAAIAAILAGGAAVGIVLASSTPTGTETASAPAASRGKVGSGPPCVLVDAIALQRGYVAPGETCEIPGVGSVDLEWAKTLMGDTLVDVLVHDGTDITTYASTTRYVPRPVRVALHVRDRGCAVPNCDRDEHLERDHTDDFALTHDTSYRNLKHFCSPDHDAKTHRGAHLDRHGDDWWWHPPPDPPSPSEHAEPPPPIEPIVGPVGRHLTPWNLDHLPGPPGEPSESSESSKRAPDSADQPPRLDFGPAA